MSKAERPKSKVRIMAPFMMIMLAIFLAGTVIVFAAEIKNDEFIEVTVEEAMTVTLIENASMISRNPENTVTIEPGETIRVTTRESRGTPTMFARVLGTTHYRGILEDGRSVDLPREFAERHL